MAVSALAMTVPSACSIPCHPGVGGRRYLRPHTSLALPAKHRESRSTRPRPCQAYRVQGMQTPDHALANPCP